jgi:hypothetical protein
MNININKTSGVGVANMKEKIQQEKEKILKRYKNKEISYYYEKKNYLSFYDVNKTIPIYKKMHGLLMKDSLFIEKIESKIEKANKQALSVLKAEKEDMKRRYANEWSRIKRYKKGKKAMFFDEQSDYCSTVDSKKQHPYNQGADDKSEAKVLFANFEIRCNRFLQLIPLKEYNRLKRNKIFKSILEMDLNFALNYFNDTVKIETYRAALEELSNHVMNGEYYDEKMQLHFKPMCFYFLEFLYFVSTVAVNNKFLPLKYYTGQPEHMILFSNAMNRMLYFVRRAQRRVEFTVEDVLFYMEHLVLSDHQFLSILQNIDSYIEHMENLLRYRTLFNSLYNLTYNTYVCASRKLDYVFDIAELRKIITSELTNFFQDKIV